MRQQAFCSSHAERAVSANAFVKIYFKLYSNSQNNGKNKKTPLNGAPSN